MDKKSAIRQQLIKQRTSLSSDDRQAKNRAIRQRLLDEFDWSNVSRLHIYSSRTDWGEVDTHDIIDSLQRLHPELSIDVASHQRNQPATTGHSYDVVVVPVLGFDDNNNRLGLGIGWYDRFLSTQPSAYKLGIAYSESRVDELPTEEHDQALDQIISA